MEGCSLLLRYTEKVAGAPPLHEAFLYPDTLPRDGIGFHRERPRVAGSYGATLLAVAGQYLPRLAANIGVRVVLDEGQAKSFDRLPVFKTAEVGEKRIGMLGMTRNER